VDRLGVGDGALICSIVPVGRVVPSVASPIVDCGFSALSLSVPPDAPELRLADDRAGKSKEALSMHANENLRLKGMSAAVAWR
jgi:hypothetical protein